jgi:anti-sigma B factor antagonist
VEVSQDGRTLTVSVSGEVDLASAERLRDTLVSSANGPPGHDVVLRLGGLEFLDARGMAALVEAHHILAEAGGGLVIVDVPPFIRKLFEITELGSVLDIR